MKRSEVESSTKGKAIYLASYEARRDMKTSNRAPSCWSGISDQEDYPEASAEYG